MSDCIFCALAKGDIPCSKIYETGSVLGFLDLNPIHPGHALIIPKQHTETVFDLPDDLAQPIIEAVRKVGSAVMEATGAGGVNVLQNNYPTAGQAVPHVHWHIIPRFDDDGLEFWPHGTYPSMDAMDAMAERIREVL